MSVTSSRFHDAFIPESPQHWRERGTGYKKDTLLLITLKLQSDSPKGREPGCEVFVKAGAVNPAGPAVAKLPLVAFNQWPLWDLSGMLSPVK